MNENWEIIYIPPIIFSDSKHPLHVQLEVLDTAGAEQFTSLNEVYIKVATSFNTICRSSDNPHQSGRGFVLVFRSKFLPTWSLFCLNHLIVWHRKQAYKKWTTCGNRLLGLKGPMWCVVENSSPRVDVTYVYAENPNRRCWNKARSCQRTRGP